MSESPWMTPDHEQGSATVLNTPSDGGYIMCSLPSVYPAWAD
jgi:hypothetical protein